MIEEWAVHALDHYGSFCLIICGHYAFQAHNLNNVVQPTLNRYLNNISYVDTLICWYPKTSRVSGRTTTENAVVLCLGRTQEARTLSLPSPLINLLVLSGTKTKPFRVYVLLFRRPRH